MFSLRSKIQKQRAIPVFSGGKRTGIKAGTKSQKRFPIGSRGLYRGQSRFSKYLIANNMGNVALSQCSKTE